MTNTFSFLDIKMNVLSLCSVHLVEGGVGVEEDKDPLRDDPVLNAKVIL